MLALLVILGCDHGAQARYDLVRKKCGLGQGEFVALPFSSEGASLSVSESCSRASGKALGVDWEQFQAQPTDIVWPEQTPDYLIAGFLVVIGADLGVVGELRGFVPDGASLDAQLDQFEQAEAADDSSPAGVFWLWWIEQAISASVPGRSDTGLLGFDAGTLYVYLEPDGEPALSQEEHPATVSRGIAHELGHAAPESDHTACPDGSMSCDSDGRGAFGVGLAFLQAWWAQNAASVPVEDCAAAQYNFLVDCSYVDDWTGVPACEDRAAFQCSG